MTDQVYTTESTRASERVMANESGGISMDDYESLMATSDVELLKKAWRDEKSSPEILHYQSPLVQRSREQIQLMEENIKEFSGSGYDPLIVSIYQMDLNRTLYLLKSYLRIRLHKIERDMIHISKTDLKDRLSEEEQTFTERCCECMEKYVDESVLSKLPTGYQSNLKQSNASEEDDMVPEPNLDTFVFCKSESSIGSIPLDDSGDEIVDLVAGDLYVLRYKSIKTYVESGQIDLV